MQKTRNIYLVSSKKNIKDVTNLELLQIDYLNFDENIEQYDGFIFTSKNGVKSFVLKYDIKDKECYAISNPTAKELEKYGAKVKYISKSAHGNEFAYELIDILKAKKVLYVKAKKVASDLLKILNENGIDCKGVVGYESKCSKGEKKLEKDSIIVFTSPSTIKCFMNNYSWQNHYHAVVIGQTTAKSLPKNINYTVSDIQTIENCIEIARQI